MSLIDQLLRVSDAYAIAANVGDTTVSWRLFGDSKKLPAIRDGADIQSRRLETAMQWLSNNWPEGACWPADIPRPDADRSDEAAA